MEEEQLREVAGGGSNTEKTSDLVNNEVGLKRQVNLLNGVALLVGTIIGSGIFASPRAVAHHMGSTGAILLTWLGCGILSMLAALTWCELGTMFPNASGGEYTYVTEAFGPLAGFLFAFSSIMVIRPAALSLIAITCGDYIMTAFGIGNQQLYSKIIAAVLIGLLLTI